MKLSVRDEYALRALIVLGETYEQGLTRIRAIADQQHIPRRFLEQILNDLRMGGFLESRRGVAGGYRLARAPRDITLAALLRHLQGFTAPPAEDAAASGSPSPDDVATAIQGVMQEAQEALFKVLEQVTLADLCNRVRQQHEKTAAGFVYVI